MGADSMSFQKLVHVGVDGDGFGRAAQQLRRAGGVLRLRGFGAAEEQGGALHADQFEVDAERELLLRLVHPGAPGIGPALHTVGPFAFLGDTDVSLPDVEAGRLHLVHVDATLQAVGGGEDHRGVHGVVAFAEDVGLDEEAFVDDGLDGVGTVGDQRRDAGHRDPAEATFRAHQTTRGRGGRSEVCSHSPEPSGRLRSEGGILGHFSDRARPPSDPAAHDGRVAPGSAAE